MRKKKCIDHSWIRGDQHIPTLMKMGSYARGIWVCEICGKKRI